MGSEAALSMVGVNCSINSTDCPLDGAYIHWKVGAYLWIVIDEVGHQKPEGGEGLHEMEYLASLLQAAVIDIDFRWGEILHGLSGGI